MNEQKIEELKKKYPGGIYEGEISFNDGDGNSYTVTFIHRKPTTTDGEIYAKTAQKSVAVANLNLIQSLIIHPEPGPVIEQLRDYPAAYAQFVHEALAPFFGEITKARSMKL